MALTQNQKYYYVLLQKKKLIVINGQLPIFWNKKVAKDNQKLYRCDLVRISGVELGKLIADQIATEV